MHSKSLIHARWLAPVEPAAVVLERHSVAVRDGRIEAVLPSDDARTRFPDYDAVHLDRHLLIPGLVNAHTHAAMSLMRGLADDLPLMRWLTDHIWPVELKHASRDFVRDGTLLACAEMLRGGITCFNDMYFFPEAALDAALETGMRASLGAIVVEFPSAYASDPDDYLQKGLALRDRCREHPRISFCIAPHAPYTVSDATFRRVSRLAAELDLPIHVHVHETLEEVERSLAEHGVRPLERLRNLGLLGPNLLAVHAVHLSGEEIDVLARHGCSVVHCPSSNLKLASGFAPVTALLRAGVNVALGTDGAASNNRLDLLQEMRHAALLAKAVASDAEALPAHDTLRCATLAGATALGLDHAIGSIVPGKSADLVAVSLDAAELQPVYDPVSHLIYACGREHVTDVWIAGEPVIRERVYIRLDVSDLQRRVALWQTKILN